ncbi:Uncharacterized protein APZ42_018080, partial [Daphnia magna]
MLESRYIRLSSKLALINIGKRKQQQKYIDDIYTLIRASSKDEYLELLLSMSVSWDKSFYAYFYDNIHPDIDRIGRWSFSKYGVDSVTTRVETSALET